MNIATFGSAVILALLLLSSPAVSAERTPRGKLDAAFGSERAETIVKAANRLLDRNKIQEGLPAPLAHGCMGAAALVPFEGDRARDRLRGIAQALAGLVGGRGWSISKNRQSAACSEPGTFDAFQDGSCNPQGTAYVYQTGLAVACLGTASRILGDVELRKAAERAIAATWDLGTAPPGCKDCFYYWYSDNQNDEGRYVRNTNMLMGVGLLRLYQANGNGKLLARVRAIANTERMEIAAGNYGYLSVADDKWKAEPAKQRYRIDNHLAAQAIGVLEIGLALKDARIIDDARWLMEGWMSCPGDNCRRMPCRRWGAADNCSATLSAAPCAFRNQQKKYADACRQFLNRSTRLNAHQLWIVLSDIK